MRRTFVALVLAGVTGFVAAGCGDGNGSADMSHAMPDLAVMNKLNCEGVGSCVYNCLLNQLATSIRACAETVCGPQAKMGSVTLWENAVICGEDYCTGATDMSTPKCVDHILTGDLGTGDELCDPGVSAADCAQPTYMSTVCSPCLIQARNYWIFDQTNPQAPGPPTFMCTMASSADCMGANTMCTQSFAACRNDM